MELTRRKRYRPCPLEDVAETDEDIPDFIIDIDIVEPR
jgi:hypothetical protein